MPVDRAVAADLAARVLRLYTGTEETLIEGLARRLASGLDRPTWATDKLAAVGEVRRWVQGLLDALAGPMRDAVAEALIEAFSRGADAAQAELARYATGAARLIEVQRALSGSQAALAMASADLAGRLERMHLQIVRSTLDIYRDTVSRATGDVLHGAMTRRAAAERAWLRLLDQGVTAFVDVRGRRWSLAGYVEMATRTATARAAVQGHLDRLETAGVDLVIVSDAAQECARCRPFEGKILRRHGGPGARTITVQHATEDRQFRVRVAGSVAEAIAAGLMHPNCRHNLSAYLPGLTVAPTDTADPEGDAARQQLRAMERQVRAFKQRAIGVEPFDKRAAGRYRADARRVQATIAQHVAAHDLTRRRDREQLDLGNRRSA